MINNTPVSLEEWKQVALKLWKLLDNIDTAGDMFKPTIGGYFKYVQKENEKRFALLDMEKYDPDPFYGHVGKATSINTKCINSGS